MIINKNEAKTKTKYISCDCKCKFNNPTWHSNQKSNNNTCQCECKNCRTCKKDYSWNTSKCICENIKYLKSMANTSVIMCGEIISVMDIVATKMTNAIARNGPINSDSKNVRYKINCYIFTKVLLAIILLLIITIICYHYAKNRAKQKSIDLLTI